MSLSGKLLSSLCIHHIPQQEKLIVEMLKGIPRVFDTSNLWKAHQGLIICANFKIMYCVYAYIWCIIELITHHLAEENICAL